VLQCVVVCCSVWQCVAVFGSAFQCVVSTKKKEAGFLDDNELFLLHKVSCSVFQYVALRCSARCRPNSRILLAYDNTRSSLQEKCYIKLQ